MKLRTQTHIIQTERVELACTDSRLAGHWQDRSNKIVHEIIQPALDAFLSQAVSEDEHLVMDKIELDLGVVKSNELAMVLEQELRRIVDRAIAEARRQNAVHKAKNEAGGALGVSSDVDRQIDHQAGARLISDKTREVEAVIYFLTHGRMPFWWSETNPFSDTWPTDLRLTQQALKTVLLQSRRARLRLVWQFEPNVLGSLCNILIGEQDLNAGWGWLKTVIKSLVDRSEVDIPVLVEYLKDAYWMVWLEYSIGMRRASPALDEILREVSGNRAVLRIVNRALQNEIAGQIDRNTPEVIQRMLGNSRAVDATLESSTSDSQKYGVLDSSATPRGVESETPVESDKSTGASQMEDTAARPDREIRQHEAIFVQDAGLILLHPFLPELFKEQGLWKDGKEFVSHKAHARAVQLLGYLASGEPGNDEYRLVLPKLLCTFPFYEPLPSRGQLTRQEMRACDELMEAIVGHWNALKNTSPAGLREAFFHRDGKLLKEEKSWRLLVERKAQDVLLDALPWGFSMIKLPWMPEILRVSWT